MLLSIGSWATSGLAGERMQSRQALRQGECCEIATFSTLPLASMCCLNTYETVRLDLRLTSERLQGGRSGEEFHNLVANSHEVGVNRDGPRLPKLEIGLGSDFRTLTSTLRFRSTHSEANARYMAAKHERQRLKK